MKPIRSTGGPYVGLGRCDVQSWSGVDGKSFIGADAPQSTDYDGAGELTDGGKFIPCYIAKLVGSKSDALLVSMPLTTYLLFADQNSARLVQVHHCDEDWTSSRVTFADFDAALPKISECVPFSLAEEGLVFFDSSYPAEWVGDDFLPINLAPGHYVFSAALYEPDDRTLLTMLWITRSS